MTDVDKQHVTTKSFTESQANYGEIFDQEGYLQQYYGAMLSKTITGSIKNPLFEPSREFDDHQKEDIIRCVRFKIRNLKFYIEHILQDMQAPVKVLDIGTGPFCGSVMYISAFEKVESIICSDYVESNQNYIKDIIFAPTSEQNGRFNWSQFMSIVYGDKNTKFVETFREKCRKVSHVDLSCLSEGLSDVESSGPYNIITSEWTFSEGTKDLTEYEELLKRCNNMLTVGGALLVEDVLEETFSTPEFGEIDIKYPSVWISEPWIRDAMVRQGFVVEQINLFYNNERNSPHFDGLGEIFVWATKIKNV